MTGTRQPASVGPRLPFLQRLSPGWTFTALALLVWLFVHGDFGITCDETVQSDYGEAVRNYIFGQQSFAEFCHSPGLPDNIYFYGPALDLFCATTAHAFGADIFSVRHGVQGLMWVAMFYPICVLGWRISGKAGAWFAGFALLGMPSLFGQAFNNPKDLPLACAAIWLLHVSVAVAGRQQSGWRQALKLGGAFGFVLAMRPGAWFLCALPALALLAHGWNVQPPARAGRWKTVLGTLPILGAIIVVGWLLMILPWPNAWHSPLAYPVKAAGLALHFQEIYPVLFRGSIYPSNKLPWDYLASYLVLTLPPPFLILGAWGHLVSWRKLRESVPAAAAVLGASFLVWFPLATFAAVRPNVYDGMRHFLFMLPALALIVGVAAADVAGHLQKVCGNWAAAGMVMVLLSAGPAMVRLHPYENVYYNFLAGDKATLHEHYETDYWASSYREAALWINSAQSRQSRQLCVLVAGSEFVYPAFTHFLDKKIKAVRVGVGDFSNASLAPGVDYYVTTARYGQWLNFTNSPVAHRIERDGITLAVIRGSPRN